MAEISNETEPARGVPSLAGRIGVLVVNLGTPEAPTASAVRDYLRQFLSDARVIEDQGPLWKGLRIRRGFITTLGCITKIRDSWKKP